MRLGPSPDRVLAAVGAVCLVLGLAVLAGWHLRLAWLVQIHPALMPMPYNTALGFAFFGVGLVALSRGHTMWARGAVGVALLIGIITVAEYLFGWSGGIDQWFLRQESSGGGGHPGRMAFATAAAFTCSGAAVFVRDVEWHRRSRYPIAGLLAVASITLAIVNLLWYVIDIRPLYGSGGHAHMAAHSATGHLLIGAALVWSSVRGGGGATEGRAEGWPLLAFWAIAMLTALLWGGLLHNEDVRLRELLLRDARWLAKVVDNDVLERRGALERMARRWEAGGGVARAGWVREATSYIDDLPGLGALEWADSAGRVRWVVPLAEHERVSGLDLNAEPGRAAMLARARQTGTIASSEPVTLAQGGAGFLLARALKVGARADGYLVAAFRLDELLRHSLGADAARTPAHALEYEGWEVYRAVSADTESQGLSALVPMDMGDGHWALRLWPDSIEITTQRSALPWVVLASGLSIALLAAFGIWLWGLGARRAREAALANAALSQSEERLRDAQRVARIGSYSVDLASGKTVWSDELFSIYGYPVGAFEPDFVRHVQPLMRPEDLAVAGRAIQGLMTEGRPYALEFIITRPDGAVRTLYTEAQIVGAESGRGRYMLGTVQDITERKLAEQQRIEQQHSLALALQASHAGYYVLDLLRGRAEWDAQAYAVYGQSPETFDTSIENVTGMVIAEDRDMLERFGALLQTDATDWHEVYRVRGADGAIRTIEGFGYIVRAADGTALRVIGTVVDITARRAAEARLRDTTGMLDSIIENIPNMVFVKRAEDLRFVLLNRAGEELLGYARADLIGKNDHDFFPPEQADFFSARDRAVLASDAVQDTPQEVIQTRHRGARILHTRKIAVRDETGAPRYLLGISEDITDADQVAQQLKDGATRLQATLDTVVDGVITINDKGLVESINPAAQRVFGYGADEVVGHNVSMLMPEPYQSQHDGYLAHYHTTGTARVIGIGREVEGRRKDGSTFPLELAVSAMQLGERRMYTGVVRDITERRRTDQLKSEFVSTVSHELRTPLTSIRGALGLLQGGAVGALDVKVSELVKIAASNTDRLLLLINDILDVQKIEAGKMAFHFRAVDVAELLARALHDNQVYADRFGVRFVITAAPKGLVVRADDARLAQVLSNLLSNAAKFSGRGGEVELSALARGDEVRIAVRDHGSGIPEEFQPRVFEKFSQSDASDARQKGGSGLGLSIARLIVQRHGGRIAFESASGQGTTFTVDLPALREQAGRRPAPDGAVAGAVTVLVVEDDPDLAGIIGRILVEGGFACEIAYSGKEAEDWLRAEPHRFHAVTLDLGLPDEDGLVLLRRWRADPELSAIPVVVVSAIADEARSNLNGGAAAVVDWINKPIDTGRLLQALDLAVGARRDGRVLHVEDDASVRTVVEALLHGRCALTGAGTLARARELLAQEQFDLVLLDIGLPDGSGIDLLEQVERSAHAPRVVIFSADEAGPDYGARVSQVLVKSRARNADLLRVVRGVLAGAGKR